MTFEVALNVSENKVNKQLKTSKGGLNNKSYYM